MRDVLGFSSVDAGGGGWLIFALPPAELAAHPTDGDGRHELHLMCDDVHATVEELSRKGVEFVRPVSDEGFGLVTAMKLPGGGEARPLRATASKSAFASRVRKGIRRGPP